MPRDCDFEVSLCDAEPRIHRRFLVRDAGTFATLHKAIQDACGWENYTCSPSAGRPPITRASDSLRDEGPLKELAYVQP